MYSTTAYLYQQKQQVLVSNTSGAYFDRRWQPVYAKELKIYKGSDNVILFEFINQDQKPVNISGSTITFRINDPLSDQVLLAQDLVILNAQFGRAKVTISELSTLNIENRTCNWSLERSNGEAWEPVFVDAYSDSSGVIRILDGVYPQFQISSKLTVPDHQPQEIASKNRVHTSEAYINGSSITTFQFDFENFTGNIKAQAADTQLGPWYDTGIQAQYINQEDRTYINVIGNYTYLRWEINQYGIGATATSTISNGAVSSVSVASGGTDYLTTGAPRVEIEGLGVGATATGTISANSVSSISLTSGGSGYVQEPTVKINLGKIDQIKYR